ncbi:histidinol dehydrogenase [Pseudoglutamicibacter cumminsii]|uniref:Histidinol dehydrogenase n=1 Tax=Pseudoglutamicibacter cumminsii TaxID=156979 RepID=A0ABX5L3X6_9MICC|nr:histidinol dehydrogenase [Pseudoglutamicibacter cumminsii]PWI27334.1 histidinol dehydrogenase [Pseudoglutamicibacter cumminsii]
MSNVAETDVLPLIDLRGTDDAALRAGLPRLQASTSTEHQSVVANILKMVREGGATAVTALTEQFDGVAVPSLRVPAGAMVEALEGLDADVRRGLEVAIERARTFAADHKPAPTTTTFGPGASVTMRWEPVRRVGLYVPGGLAVYPSSVVMNVVPAQEAGVGSIALVSPPAKDGSGLPHPTILAAAQLLGVDEVYAVGGAQAIGALAHGLDTDADAGLDTALEPVDLITGPGNVFVATAKALVKGEVGIDSEAGPTEIAIVADASADPKIVAADAISQAEHDPNAASVIITWDEALVDVFRSATWERAQHTKHSERVLTALSGPQSGIVLVDDHDAAIAAANHYAAEHLELLTEDPEADAQLITQAGAVFLGAYSPVSLGDYVAGSNHVLPTMGTARYASGLNVTTFLKAVQEIRYDRAALAEVAEHVVALSSAEDLPAHGEAVTARDL